MRILSLLLVLMLTMPLFAMANSPAEQAASQWLATVDHGDFGDSWHQSAPFFQQQLSKTNWQRALNQVRKPLGRVISRHQLGSQQHTSLPGVPEGEYLIIQYQTEFVNKKSAIETLTLIKEDTLWLPVGYFIK